jgi:hypothetical protein
MTQGLEYRVDLKGAANAQREVDALNRSFDVGAVSAAKMGRQMDRATGPTRDVGRAALEGSRALEDLQYGIGGVVNNIPSLIMALGGSAGLTAVISLAAVGANQLYKNFVEVPKGAKKAAKGSIDALADLRKEIDDLNIELQSLASGDSVKRIRAQALAEDARAEAQAAGEAFRSRFGDVSPRFIESQRAMADVSKTSKDIVTAYDKAMQIGLKAAAAQAAANKLVQVEQFRALKAQDDLDEKNAKREGKKADKDADDLAKTRYDLFIAEMTGEDKALAAINKARKADAKKQRDAEARDVANEFRAMDKAKEDAEKAHTRMVEREAKERERIRKKEAREAQREAEAQGRAVAGITMRTAGIIAEGAVAVAEGRQDALAAVMASLAQEAGGFITLKGGEVLAAGVAGSALGNPAGVGQIAIGAGLIAAGAAVTAGGPAAVNAIMGAGGKSGGSTAGTRERGVSPRRDNGGGAGGGPLVLNLTYGVAGPLPEDTARLVARELAVGRRRGGR